MIEESVIEKKKTTFLEYLKLNEVEKKTEAIFKKKESDKKQYF